MMIFHGSTSMHLQSSSILDWDFPWNKPSSYWGIYIYGNPHIPYTGWCWYIASKQETDGNTSPSTKFHYYIFLQSMEIASTYSNSFQGASWPLKHSQRSRPSRPSAAGSTTSSWQLSGFVTGANLRCTSCIQLGHYERPVQKFRNDPRGIGICEAMKHFVALSCTFTVCALKFLPVRLQV